MSQAGRAAAIAAALWMSACGSSSRSQSAATPSSPGSPTPAGPTFTVSGTITALAATAADADTNDPAAPVAHNDTAATAQALPGNVTVGGWASQSADPEDWYRATLAAGQVVAVEIADWTNGGPNDLDLCLYTAATPPARVTCSVGTGPTEVAQIPAAGTYLIQVRAFSGASRYVLSLAAGPLALPAAGALRLEADFVPGDVLVRFRDGAPAAAAAEATSAPGLAARAQALGLEPLGGGEGREMAFRLGAGAARSRAFAASAVRELPRDVAAEAVDPLEAARADTIALVKALRARPDVASADPNYVFHPTAVPDDPRFGSQWDLPMIALPAAWDVTTGTPPKGGDVVVAVVDTGVFLAHPDLAGKLVPGYDLISSVSMSNDGDGIDPNPDDPGDSADIRAASFHGTHVSGTIGAATSNGVGVAGVSWGAKIMPVRVLGIGGGTSADIIQGIRFAAGLSNDSGTLPAQRADVINLSLGCSGCPFSQTEQDAYAAVRAAGVVVVAAAGNDGANVVSFPAAYTGVLSVSAIGPGKVRASYSSFGATVDIAAPGGDASAPVPAAPQNEILSTWVDASSGTRQPVYGFLEGTSMATPHVSGVVALMKAVCPTLTPDQVDAFLAAGGMTDDLGAPGRDDFYGWGLVNAQKAVNTARGQCSAPAGSALGATPAFLEFAPARSALSITTAILGGGTLTAPVTASDDATWLTLTPPASGNGIGTWTATASRAGLAAGAYAGTITFTAPFATGTVSTRVPVTMQVGGASAAGDAGYVHVRLLDGSGNVVAEVARSAAAGRYPFSFGGVQAGSYTLVAGTEMGGAGALCGAGDACGAYPAAGAPAPIDVSGDRSGIDFTVGFDVALGAAASPAAGSKAVRP